MDAKDVQLLAALFRRPRAAYRELGVRVGLSPNAAKARVRRMAEQGVLQGFAVTPAPEMLGLGEGLLVFTDVHDVVDREADILRDLPDATGVRFVDVGVDGMVLVWAYARDAADWERIERAAVSAVGKGPAHVEFHPSGGPTEVPAAEWRLIRALVPDGRATIGDLARRSGLSVKTVKRRLAALLGSGRVRVEPVLSPSEATGLALASFHVALRPDAAVSDVLTLLPDDAIAQTSRDPRRVTFHVARATLRDIQADHRALRASPAVERVLCSLATRRCADAWLDEAVAAKLAPARPLEAAPVPVPMPRS